MAPKHLWKNFSNKPNFEKQTEKHQQPVVMIDISLVRVDGKIKIPPLPKITANMIHSKIKALVGKKKIEKAKELLETALALGFSGKRLEGWKKKLYKKNIKKYNVEKLNQTKEKKNEQVRQGKDSGKIGGDEGPHKEG